MVELTDPELERFARHIVLPKVGGVGQKRLKAASVAVVGAGGIGSAVIPVLGTSGIGRLTIIDGDTVAEDNLHRQAIFAENDVGLPKAEIAASYARARNRFATVGAIGERLTRETAQAMLRGHDLVVDGSDNFATRLAVSDACVALGLPLVSAAAIQFQGQVGSWRTRPCFRCFVGNAFDSEDCDNCAELGVLGALAAATGSFAALLAINAILGIGVDSSGRLHLLDGERLAWRAISIPPDPNCSACGSAKDASDPLD